MSERNVMQLRYKENIIAASIQTRQLVLNPIRRTDYGLWAERAWRSLHLYFLLHGLLLACLVVTVLSIMAHSKHPLYAVAKCRRIWVQN